MQPVAVRTFGKACAEIPCFRFVLVLLLVLVLDFSGEFDDEDDGENEEDDTFGFFTPALNRTPEELA
jgi:hypothetical protein